jgi:hypothetical protein
VGLQGSYDACLSDGARARANVNFALDRILLSLSVGALDRTARDLLLL